MMKKTRKNRNKHLLTKRLALSIGGFGTVVVITALSGGIWLYQQCEDTILETIQRGLQKTASIQAADFHTRMPTEFIAKDGETVLKSLSYTNHNYQTFQDINPVVFDAFIAIEDPDFYEHAGVDFFSTLRAVLKTLLFDDVQGGSTITQQLAKNIFLTMDQTIWRKLEEMVIAQELETKFEKEEILEFYVNNINYANGNYSFESASHYYFNRESEDLSVAEVAYLVGIPNNPTLFDPLTNPDATKERQLLILKQMYEHAFIDESTYQQAINESIELDIQPFVTNNSAGTDYALNYAIQKATEILMQEQGFQFRYHFKTDDERATYFELYDAAYSVSREQLVSGGYRIETAIDPTVQSQLQKIVDDELIDFTELNEQDGLFAKQAAATVIDNKTGLVTAIVGGRSQEENTFNRAVLGARQPGSSIKPLVSYTPAFERGHVPDEKMEDKAIENGPLNWYTGYRGNVTLRYATEVSLNTIPFRLTESIGADVAVGYLESMQFRYLTPADRTSPIIAVGGFERGTTTLEMASAYATLANGGTYISPSNIQSLSKSNTGEVLFTHVPTGTQVYSPGASYLMTDVLKGAMTTAHSTGYPYRMRTVTNQALKTGTTDDDKDFWMTGYTPHYSMAVWVGDDTPSTQTKAANKAAGFIWRNMMEWLHVGLEDIAFAKPNSVYLDKSGTLRTELDTLSAKTDSRLAAETARKQSAMRAQQLRLEEESYRIVHGLSESEELARESKAEQLISALERKTLASLDELETIQSMLDEAFQAIEAVKRPSAYSSLYGRYQTCKSRFAQTELSLIHARDEQERLEQERLEQERLEQEQANQTPTPEPPIIQPEPEPEPEPAPEPDPAPTPLPDTE